MKALTITQCIKALRDYAENWYQEYAGDPEWVADNKLFFQQKLFDFVNDRRPHNRQFMQYAGCMIYPTYEDTVADMIMILERDSSDERHRYGNRNGDYLSSDKMQKLIEKLKTTPIRTKAHIELMNAVDCYSKRQTRDEHPSGSFDSKGRWYPANPLECCKAIRSPSARYPYSLMLHCRTVDHIANMYGVDAKQMRREVKKLKASTTIKTKAVG